MYCCGFESVTFVGMSTTTTTKTSQVFVPETDAKSIINDDFEFRLIRRPTSECSPADQCQTISGADDLDASTDDREKKIQGRLSTEEDERECDQARASGKNIIDHKGYHEVLEKRIEEEGEEDDASDCVEKLEISKAGLKIDHHKGAEELEEEEEEEINDGFRTPTSLKSKIPAIQRCPPAPRKPRSETSMKRSRPSSSTTSCRVRIDVSDHVLDSLFQPLVVSDLIRPSNKKARKIN